MLAFHLVILIVLVARSVNIANMEMPNREHQAIAWIGAMVFILSLAAWDLFLLARMYHGS